VKPSIRFVACTLFCACACACSGGGSSANPTGSKVFLAFAENFRGYHSWPSFDVSATAPAAGIHDGSLVMEYIDPTPPSGSTEFPLGTLVVKEATGGTGGDQIFAQVKRGGGFNPGLPNWEWFELQNVADGRDGVIVVWRGGPPAGEKYGGNPNICNSCHAACGNNDGVCAPALQLSNF
jgi:hypothetical protein